MLFPQEEQWIRLHAWSIEHDVEVHSLYLGEPMLMEDLLCFFDGETLFICCRGLPRYRTDIESACTSVLNAWPLRKPRRINCWGDRVPGRSSFEAHGYVRVYQQARDPYNEEVIVDFDHAPSMQRLRRRRREVRQRGRRFECRTSDRRGLRWEDIGLLRQFLEDFGEDLDSIDLSYFLTVPQSLASRVPETTVRVELSVGAEMRGFAFATILRPGFGALHVAIWDRGSRGACDSLYSAVLAELERRGVRTVSLGVTIHAGLHRYKLKWGARAVGPGLEQAIWCDRQDAAAADLRAYHWPSALALHGRQNR